MFIFRAFQMAYPNLVKGRYKALLRLKWADRILVLKDGRLVEQGSYDTLLAHKGFYSALYEGQLEKQDS